MAASASYVFSRRPGRHPSFDRSWKLKGHPQHFSKDTWNHLANLSKRYLSPVSSLAFSRTLEVYLCHNLNKPQKPAYLPRCFFPPRRESNFKTQGKARAWQNAGPWYEESGASETILCHLLSLPGITPRQGFLFQRSREKHVGQQDFSGLWTQTVIQFLNSYEHTL